MEIKNESQNLEINTATRPWHHLPNHLAELFLERLPPIDYIRFAFVCTDWKSIQNEHRHHRSPFPPWLLPYLQFLTENLVNYYSLHDSELRQLCIPNAALKVNGFASSHGWIFMLKIPIPPKPVFLLNPVMNSMIQLPPLNTTESSYAITGALSVPPADPDCLALLIDPCYSNVFMCRVAEQREWTSFGFPQDENLPQFYRSNGSIIYCNGMFYCLGNGYFFEINPIFPAPATRLLDMDRRQLLVESKLIKHACHYLLESDGKVLLVAGLYHIEDKDLQRFEVYEADFHKMLWIRMKTLGERVLFVAEKGTLCMLASDVRCKSNCIYHAREKNYDEYPPTVAWKVYDMDIMGWTDNGPPCPYDAKYPSKSYFGHWLLPSLDGSIPSYSYLNQ